MFLTTDCDSFVLKHQTDASRYRIAYESCVLSGVGNDSMTAGFKVLPARLSSQVGMTGSPVKNSRRRKERFILPLNL